MIVSHQNGTAEVVLNKDVPYEVLKNVVEEQGYKELVSSNEEDGSKTVNYSATLSLVVGKM